uniref:BUD13 homolog n=2 Tax=Macrostomum lignano TaxID=282301 RepID=A0A1I8HWX5_9PLAT
ANRIRTELRLDKLGSNMAERRSRALSRLRAEEQLRRREFRSFDEFGRTIPEIMAEEEDTPRQRMRIGLPADWVTPRGEEIQPKVDAYNEDYKPGGGSRKIFHEKVEFQTESKIKSLENQDYQPGGGNKPIFNERLEFQKEAKPKIGSLENAEYRPSGGDKKIFNDQLDFTDRAQPKVRSLENKDYEPRRPGIRVSWRSGI